jgi:hypothetical protein
MSAKTPNLEVLIQEHIASLSEPRRSDMQALHRAILGIAPKTKLWFLDGRDENGKVVSNPNIGYGHQIINYADGKTKEFYQVGISANTTGVSVYILGLDDKKFLVNTYGASIGKASVTGYCIKFKALKDINMDVLAAAIRHGFAATAQ